MFNIFRRKNTGNKNKKKSRPALADLDGNELQTGDQVLSMRYDLGECVIVESESGVEYESLVSGEKVSWVKMIDASTDRQKVKKIRKED